MSKLIPKHQTPSQPLVLSQDNTKVISPYIKSIPITETILYKQYLLDPYRNTDFNTWRKRQELIQSNKKDEKVKVDKRPSKVKDQETKQGEAIHRQQQRKELEAKVNRGIWTGIGLGGLAVAQATPAAPYIDAAFAANGGINLLKQSEEGTLGWNGETALNILQIVPFGIKGIGKGLKYADDIIREKNPIYDLYRSSQELDPTELYYYNLQNLYNKEFTFKPTTYYDKVKHRYITKQPERVAVHQDNNIFDLDYDQAFIQSDMKLYPRKTGDVIYWQINQPYFKNEAWDRIIKIPAKNINGKTVTNNSNIFDRIEISGPVDITQAEAMVHNPIHGWYDRTRFIPQIKPKTNGSLELFQRTPTTQQDTWIKPFQMNMGEMDLKTSAISGNNFGKLIGEGSEQSVYLHPTDPNKVLKVHYDSRNTSLNELRKSVKQYQTRNNVPYQLETKFEGYVTDKSGNMYPVYSQQKINEVLSTDSKNWNTNVIPRLNKQMESIGYTNSHGNYVRGNRKLTDVQPTNITELPNGEFRFIDIFPEGFKKGGTLKLISKQKQ